MVNSALTISHPNPSPFLVSKNPFGPCNSWFKKLKKACRAFGHPIKPEGNRTTKLEKVLTREWRFHYNDAHTEIPPTS
jgi:hypothetical protein